MKKYTEILAEIKKARAAIKDTAKAEALAVKIGATVSTAETIAKACDIIFLGVKPNFMASTLDEISEILAKREEKPTLVSMAAGVKIDSIEKMIPLAKEKTRNQRKERLNNGIT